MSPLPECTQDANDQLFFLLLVVHPSVHNVLPTGSCDTRLPLSLRHFGRGCSKPLVTLAWLFIFYTTLSGGAFRSR